MKEVLNLEPREYQKKIFETASRANTLVVLPTGLGKTLIALMLSVDRMKKFPGSKILFLAPTKPLAEQHFNSFGKNLPELWADLQLFTGEVPAQTRKKTFQTADIIFSTPQCIANDLAQGLYSMHEVSLLVIDEAHRCLKNYDYTKVVGYYKRQANNQRILGLTASPGSEELKVKEICEHLDVKEIEVRNRDSADVKDYLQELEFDKVEVPFPTEFIEIKVLLKRIYDSKVNELRSRNLLFGPPNKITLLKLQRKLGMQSEKNFNTMIGMSLAASAIKISHAIELLETQTLSGVNEYLMKLQKEAAEKKSKGVQKLVNTPEFSLAIGLIQGLLRKGIEHPKIEECAVIVEEQFKENPRGKIIIFTQFRETGTRIVERLNKISENSSESLVPTRTPKIKSDKNINDEISDEKQNKKSRGEENNFTVRASTFFGQAKKNGVGFSQKEQRAVLVKLNEGDINVLVATSIGEEGLDISEVSAVIFYEPVPSEIRKIQRAGRTARLAPGKLKILITKDTRDVISHYAANAREKKMYRTIDNVQKNLRETKKIKKIGDF